jgi:nucleoside-diphosphate-sugar epimerase
MEQIEKKKIMVTGGAGLIGFEVSRQLNALGHEVRLFDLGEQILRMKTYLPENIKLYYGSILDTASLRSAMAGCDLVIP